MSSDIKVLIKKFHDYIKFEKQYSKLTIKNYLIDLAQFQNNFETWSHLFDTKLNLYFYNTFF